MNTRAALMAGMPLGGDLAQAGEIKVMMSVAFKAALSGWAARDRSSPQTK